ncbi:MAG: hypothetical protein ACM3X6_03260 [Patescibacteria group bacterium]
MPSVKGLAARLKGLADAARLYYPETLLRGVEAALTVPHRFVIFYGPPGAGKSQLVQLIAEALPAELSLVPVEASWRDGAPLLGRYDEIRGIFLPGGLAAAAVRAAADPERFYVFALEEMALGEPEGYLATLLCGLDAQPPRLHLGFTGGGQGDAPGAAGGEAPLPPNLLFFGTICAQCGEKPLPRKLLDRAFLFELEFADLDRFLARWDKPFPGRTPLLEIAGLLQGHGISVGYRTFREIGAALAGAAQVGLAPDALLDQLIKSRLLPLIGGDAAAVEDCLRDLVRLLSGDEVRFPATLDKAARMLEQLGLHGHTAAYFS